MAAPRIRSISFGLSVCLLLAGVLMGCSRASNGSNPVTPGASMNGPLFERTAAGRDFPFTVTVAQAADPIGIDARGVLVSGGVRVQLLDAGGQPVWQQLVTAPGPFVINTVVRPSQAGAYQLGWQWDEPLIINNYSLQWKPGPIAASGLTPLMLLGPLGMLAVAAGFIVYAVRRTHEWRYLIFGGVCWAVAVALKVAWAVPINPSIYRALHAWPLGDWLLYLYVGALTGVFEVALVWLLLRFTRLGQVAWPRVLAFGIGFGALEALLLGLSGLGSVLAIVLAPELVPPSLSASLTGVTGLVNGLAAGWERFFTVLVHLFSNALLFYGVQRRQQRWFWLAFVFKSLMDAVAAWGQVTGLDVPKTLFIEAIVAAWGILAWRGAGWVQSRMASA
ncbi:YhfC family glutamic-type intramembrane protease [Candidatus Amarolinea aalborgensis]|uniref:YhfC family glutamic-type intramembrane protease n=1 Tax=Candidatus Amarolinea aalborgensis TaxID=2249329 RepID=UPI003BFA36C6